MWYHPRKDTLLQNSVILDKLFLYFLWRYFLLTLHRERHNWFLLYAHEWQISQELDQTPRIILGAYNICSATSYFFAFDFTSYHCISSLSDCSLRYKMAAIKSICITFNRSTFCNNFSYKCGTGGKQAGAKIRSTYAGSDLGSSLFVTIQHTDKSVFQKLKWVVHYLLGHCTDNK